MKSFRHIFSAGAWLATALGVTTLASCHDEILDAPDYTVSGDGYSAPLFAKNGGEKPQRVI